LSRSDTTAREPGRVGEPADSQYAATATHIRKRDVGKEATRRRDEASDQIEMQPQRLGLRRRNAARREYARLGKRSVSGRAHSETKNQTNEQTHKIRVAPLAKELGGGSDRVRRVEHDNVKGASVGGRYVGETVLVENRDARVAPRSLELREELTRDGRHALCGARW
jgi:hypothetical protein